jgi:hypothetical protein
MPLSSSPDMLCHRSGSGPKVNTGDDVSKTGDRKGGIQLLIDILQPVLISKVAKRKLYDSLRLFFHIESVQREYWVSIPWTISDVHYCGIKHGTWRAQIATASESGNYCDTLRKGAKAEAWQ